jgi:DNA (cytosine-5)-methyltransferase 1
MRVLDLFSGIGGFSLGLERAGMRTVQFCEIDPYCQRILAKHWPDVPCHGDIRTLKPIAADVVCGGFPCQPFSTASAGKRYGEAHDHYLWPEMLRIVRECRPTWVIGENVAGIESMALRQVVSDLEGSGYEVAPPFEIPACAVGHDHRRARFWFLAHAHQGGKHGSAEYAKAQVLPRIGNESRGMGAPYGIPSRLDRLRALGNAVVPQIPEIIGRAIMNVCSARAKNSEQGDLT